MSHDLNIVLMRPDAKVRHASQGGFRRLFAAGNIDAGIVYGRNIIQHSAPAAITSALMGVVHDGLTVKAAANTMNA